MDRGGTFTDIIGVAPDGQIRVQKILSKSGNYKDATLVGIRKILEESGKGCPLKEKYVSRIRIGTTLATNALLERRGSPVALFINSGFRDLLEIGYQARPEIFKLVIKKPELLYTNVKTVVGRINAEGKILKALDEEKVRLDFEEVFSDGIRSIAVVLMHSWKNPDHELRVAQIARETGFDHVSVSHQVLPLICIVSRGGRPP